ncbi:MAG TPA: RIP metalloprotease RseP [Thermoanaerobaculia bacterium]|nr:RIP metalloprotease RseP [Thermoanaerobaculia bacterium]
MTEILISTAGFIIVLGFLIFVHEAGHFFVAKFFRVRVLVFSFGFGKRLFGFTKGDTDYRVSLIPLGGYVRMAGDSPEENVAGNPDEFLSKPKWQRFLILFAGPFMNVFIAIAFIAIAAMVGIETPVTKPVIADVTQGKPGARAGLLAGDRIISVKGEPIGDYQDLRVIISMNAGTPVEVVYDRNGDIRKTVLTPEREQGEFGPVGRAGIAFGNEPIVGRVLPDTPAAAAGLRAGDHIVSANGEPVASLEAFAGISEKAKDAPLPIVVARGARQVSMTLAPIADEDLAISRGIIRQTKLVKLGFVPAIRYSIAENRKMLRLAMSALARLFRPEGSLKELSGPINIARISGMVVREGWLPTIMLMALISLQLGVMNLLPIPVLDGGHIMILLIEGIARRDLSLHVKERIQQVGFAALATLMIVVIYNDVITNVIRMKG